MKVIWINPVVDALHERETLETVLKAHGYQRVECVMPWGESVRKEYTDALEKAESTVIDARCPVAYNQVKENYKNDGLEFPEIEPILIHCAREISGRSDLEEIQKVITTPCRALAYQGNALQLKDTVFYAWNDFLAMIDETVEAKDLSASPIPPGYFEPLKIIHDSVSGEQPIADYFENKKYGKVQLVELLYCDQGCHNGDGVNFDE